MGERLRLAKSVIALALVLGATACARPVGDLGRPTTTVLNDEIMTNAGEWRATRTGEASGFNRTDEEEEMRDRVWRFLAAPHAKDWFYDTALELRRTRVLPTRALGFAPSRYYKWLRRADYNSSRTRYATVADDIEKDLGTLPGTFDAICEVEEIDRRRTVAAAEINRVDEAFREETEVRRSENQRHVAWFVRAVQYRYASYAYALDYLLVETPHLEARRVDSLLSDMAIYVDAGERGQFCAGFELKRERDARRALPSRAEADAPAVLILDEY